MQKTPPSHCRTKQKKNARQKKCKFHIKFERIFLLRFTFHDKVYLIHISPKKLYSWFIAMCFYACLASIQHFQTPSQLMLSKWYAERYAILTRCLRIERFSVSAEFQIKPPTYCSILLNFVHKVMWVNSAQ